MSQNQKHEKGVMTNDDEIARRKGLTFAQAEGAEALPTQLKRTEVSKQLRAVLWNYVYDGLQETADQDTWTYIGDPWRTVLKDVHVYFFHQPEMNLLQGLKKPPRP